MTMQLGLTAGSDRWGWCSEKGVQCSSAERFRASVGLRPPAMPLSPASHKGAPWPKCMGRIFHTI